MHVTCPLGCCALEITPYISREYISYINSPKRWKAGVFLFDPKYNKILLVQSHGKFWGVPKGTKNEGEEDIECAIREVREETGLELSNVDFSTLRRVKIKNRSVYYYLNIEDYEVDPSISNKEDFRTVSVQRTFKIVNDANSIGWIKLSCLKMLCDSGFIELNLHTKKLLKQFDGFV
ncbi:MAG: NUDIX domain-containing protein [Colwellia sp.]|nr:NUDIX domain-containing protein [Colwellia sp.]